MRMVLISKNKEQRKDDIIEGTILTFCFSGLSSNVQLTFPFLC